MGNQLKTDLTQKGSNMFMQNKVNQLRDGKIMKLEFVKCVTYVVVAKNK